MRKHYAGYSGELLTRQWFQCVLTDVEQHIGNVDDQSALCFPRIQDEVQLLNEFGAEFCLFELSLGCSLPCSFGSRLLAQRSCPFRLSLSLCGCPLGLGA